MDKHSDVLGVSTGRGVDKAPRIKPTQQWVSDVTKMSNVCIGEKMASSVNELKLNLCL